MKAEFWESRIKEIVNNNDDESIKLLAMLIEEAEQAKQELREKGYAHTGLSLLNTVLKEVPCSLPLTQEKKMHLILKKFHGFTKRQWENELVNEFPYSEIPDLVELVWIEAQSFISPPLSSSVPF